MFSCGWYGHGQAAVNAQSGDSVVRLNDSAKNHRIPAIDRMMELLAVLERRPKGSTIRELVGTLRLPRTTVYRILNTLQSHEVVRRSAGGAFTLGPRLLSLSSRVAVDNAGCDLSALALPHLQKLSEEIGESSRVSVLDRGATLVLVSVQGNREHALMVSPGQRFPIHAGAASKILLAHMPRQEREALLRGPLPAFTERTLTEPKKLANELVRISRQGWAKDDGEFSRSVHAFGAPIVDSSGQCVGAVSVPFLAGAEPERMEKIRRHVIDTAIAIGACVPVKREPSEMTASN
jgi:DNA-binding IclR family transcriptional regulator